MGISPVIPPDALQFTVTSNPLVSVVIQRGDITKWVGDVVVNAANPQLTALGGLNGVIHEAAGPELLRSCQINIPLNEQGVRCPPGDAVLTLGPFSPRLGASHVIHAVGPNLHDPSMQPRAAELLKSAILRALHLADDLGCMSIAIPAISCGAYGYPPDRAANCAIQAYLEFAQNRPTALRVITCVLFELSHLSCWKHAAFNCEGALSIKPRLEPTSIDRDEPAGASAAAREPKTHATPNPMGGRGGGGAVPVRSYLAARLEPREAAMCKAAGIFLYRRTPNGILEILLGTDGTTHELVPLGGKRDFKEEPIRNAVREFHEETSQLLPRQLIQSLEHRIRSSSEPSVVWIADGKYALYLVDANSIPNLYQASYDLPKRHATWYRNRSFMAASSLTEMSRLNWLPLHLLFTEMSNDHSSMRISTFLRVVLAVKPLQEWADRQQHAAPHAAAEHRHEQFAPDPSSSSGGFSMAHVANYESSSHDPNAFNDYDDADDLDRDSNPVMGKSSLGIVDTVKGVVKGAFQKLIGTAASNDSAEPVDNDSQSFGLSIPKYKSNKFSSSGPAAPGVGASSSNFSSSSSAAFSSSSSTAPAPSSAASHAASAGPAPTSSRATERPNVSGAASGNAAPESSRVNENLIESLKSEIDKARDGLRDIERKFQQERDDHQRPLPPVPDISTLKPSELTVLDPNSAEYQEVARLTTGSVRRIKKVSVPARDRRYQAYRRSLPSNPLQEVRVMHGTSVIANANAIARTGPRIDLAGSANGTAYGRGFYSSEEPSTPAGYARGTGSVCVCTVAPGNASPSADSSTTAASLAGMSPPCQSVHIAQSQWRILFHADSVRVDYVIDFGDDPTVASLDDERKEMHRKLEADRDIKEAMRIQLWHQAKAKLEMLKYFAKCCTGFLGRLAADPQLAGKLTRLFRLELQQFKLALPMYAHKEEFINTIRANQTLILKGGTGTGKTVQAPQWLYDELHFMQDPTATVAVLVPRRSIAAGMAKYVSKLRGCRVGQEVGMAVSDSVKMGPETRICFMTYGFFRAISSADKRFSKWRTVVLDEAHERNPDADLLLPQLCQAVADRKDFKLVIMSATIDVQQFASNVRQLTKSVCPVLDVPGVTFPVTVEFMTDAGWDPRATGALLNLCHQVVRVYNAEQVGNVLVFLPTARDVIDAVEHMKGLLQHDPQAVILPLHAKVSDAIKDEVSDFDKKPRNAEKRMICFGTNFAEAGITLSNITAVVETGRELDVSYDVDRDCTTSAVDWISKASHMQRRGRAGRTSPGRCYCMFTREEFDAMPEYTVAKIHKQNLDSFYLSMLNAGIDPMDDNLPDMPVARLQSAEKQLFKMGCIEEGSVDHGKTITALGHAVRRLQLPMAQAKCVVMAASQEFECSGLMAIVFAMTRAVEQHPLFERSDEGLQKKADWFNDAGGHGDHLTYLHIFSTWSENVHSAGGRDTIKSERWCRSQGLNEKTLMVAHDTLIRLHEDMRSARIPINYPPEDADMQTIVKRVLCRSLVNHAAAAISSTLKDGYYLQDGISTNPTNVRVHPSTTVPKGTSAPLLIYQTRSRGSQDQDFVNCVTLVDSNMLLEAAQASFTPNDFVKFQKSLATVQRVSFVQLFTIDLPHGYNVDKVLKSICKAVAHSVTANIQVLKQQFPMSVFKTKHDDKDLRKISVSVSCPQAEQQKIVQQVKEAVAVAQLIKCDIPDVNDAVIHSHFMKNGFPTPDNGVPVQTKLSDQFGKTTVILGDRVARSVSLIVQAGLKDYAIPQLKELLGMGDGSALLAAAAPQSPAATSAESRRLQALLNAATTRAEIEKAFGQGQAGTLMLLAHWITHRTKMWVYGGFLRDFIYGQGVHSEMDLDVGLPKDQTLTLQAGRDLIARFAQANKLGDLRTASSNPVVLSIRLPTIDGQGECQIELVDALAFAQRDPRIDFDVNNLRVVKVDEQTAQIELKYPGQPAGATVDGIVQHIRSRCMRAFKPLGDLTQRVQKMQARGWQLV
ncbi:hypothetical protein CAOG_01842 [Capsaspora owczarzaki ATCC 30864]|nr:hypothetical protein CAOG_01842 [Capsaspora owczarzaki ATCC 30864]|eukprot:XP_004364710.1 hypothetical protein CAOG_01842 [Capsaspora owczarzaki ATCC 30864]